MLPEIYREAGSASFLAGVVPRLWVGFVAPGGNGQPRTRERVRTLTILRLNAAPAIVTNKKII
jgi:hypothetical protein